MRTLVIANCILGALLAILACFVFYHNGFVWEQEENITVVVVPTDHLVTSSGNTSITVEQALSYIRECRYTHQYIVDKTDEGSMFWSSEEDKAYNLEHHKKWVKRYDQLRDLIISLDR